MNTLTVCEVSQQKIILYLISRPIIGLFSSLTISSAPYVRKCTMSFPLLRILFVTVLLFTATCPRPFYYPMISDIATLPRVIQLLDTIVSFVRKNIQGKAREQITRSIARFLHKITIKRQNVISIE